jgi:hypothetical protein
MYFELTEKERTGIDEITHLLETASVEENQALLDEHMTSV